MTADLAVVSHGTEEWRTVAEDPRYRVSSHGQVVGPRGHLLAGGITNRGYRKVQLTRGRQVYVHDLVAVTFLGARPAGHEVDHIDTDRLHNCVRNLRWLPQPDNGQRFRWIARTDDGRNVWEIHDELTPPPCDHTPLTDEQSAELLEDLGRLGWY